MRQGVWLGVAVYGVGGRNQRTGLLHGLMIDYRTTTKTRRGKGTGRRRNDLEAERARSFIALLSSSLCNSV